MKEKLKEGDILKRIFKTLGLCVEISKINENKGQLTISSEGKYRNVWFECENSRTENSKHDQIFVVYENGDARDMLYDVLFGFIKEDNRYSIYVEDDNGNDYKLFTIPKFNNLEELSIKLDMML